MRTKYIIEIIAIAILIIIGVAYFSSKGMREGAVDTDNNSNTSSSIVHNDEERDIEATVVAFGSHLKNVSILAIGSDAAAEMEREYAPYVAPELLALWKADRSIALGRETSNPYPDSMYVVSITKNANGSYTVETNVIETTTTNQKEVAGVYPVTLTLEQRQAANGTSAWMITKAVKGERGTLPQRVTMTGVYTCLLHSNTTGPQTMECAEGFRSDDGPTYALDGSLAASTQTIDLVRSGVQVRVEGLLTPVEMLSTNQWQKYQMNGVLSVTSAERI
ncbi:MAG TPA: hypothetical protein VIR98_00295 [Candidatus Paceibacterota bacterium]|jgi:hypothetical protein